MPKKKRGAGEGSISQRPDGRWMAQMTIGRKADGKPRRLTFYGKTRREAADKLTAALGDARKGTLVEPNQMTVAQWLTIWLEEYKKNRIKPTTWDSYEVQVRRHLITALGGMRLKDLRAEHLQRLYNEKLSAGLKPRSVRYIHHVIHSALDQAVKNQLVASNVGEAVELPADKRFEIKPLSLEETKQLLASTKEDRLYPAILLEFSTGLRRGELLALRWSDVDFKQGVLRVNRVLVRISNRGPEAQTKTQLTFQEPKTAASRRSVPIPDHALAELKRHKTRQRRERLLVGEAYRDQDLVFCREDGQPLDPRNFTRRFDRMLAQAGVPHIRFHDARHTFATLLLELGEHPKVVQQLLGHARIATTLDTYSHVSLDLEKRAAAKLDDALKEEPNSEDNSHG